MCSNCNCVEGPMEIITSTNWPRLCNYHWALGEGSCRPSIAKSCIFVVAVVFHRSWKLGIVLKCRIFSFCYLFFNFTSFNIQIYSYVCIYVYINSNKPCLPVALFACHLVHSPLNIEESLLNFSEAILASSNWPWMIRKACLCTWLSLISSGLKQPG